MGLQLCNAPLFNNHKNNAATLNYNDFKKGITE